MNSEALMTILYNTASQEEYSQQIGYKEVLAETQVENSPKTFFISQPMSGLTVDEILERRLQLEQYAEWLLSPTPIIFIDSFNPNALNEGRPLEELGHCISLMEKADFILMAKGWENSKGCQVEHFAAKTYGKSIFFERDITTKRFDFSENFCYNKYRKM